MDDRAFLDLLDRDDPPAEGAPLLRAVWHGLRGEWDAAHEIAQDDLTDAGSWVHGWLHRIEGDLGNAAYWYRSAGRPVFVGSTDEEGRAIALSLRPRAAGR